MKLDSANGPLLGMAAITGAAIGFLAALTCCLICFAGYRLATAGVSGLDGGWAASTMIFLAIVASAGALGLLSILDQLSESRRVKGKIDASRLPLLPAVARAAVRLPQPFTG
jgi:hypothetical protein